MEFSTTLNTFAFNDLGYGLHIKIPNEVFSQIIKIAPNKRVICTFNSTLIHHCALMPKDNFHFILLNKEICKKLNCKIGDSLSIELKKENAKYGLPISEEMEEVLYSDPEGTFLFNKLTPGKQRTLIHIVNKIKSINLKIERSFIIIEHLKKLNGELDYELLQQDFKDYRNKMKF